MRTRRDDTNLNLSDVAMTMKFDQGHQNWHENVKKVIIKQSFKDLAQKY